VQPVPEGGLTGQTMVEIRFNDQGLFPFVEMVDKLRARAIGQRRETREANTLRESVSRCDHVQFNSTYSILRSGLRCTGECAAGE
jgi:hypothetical protein